MSSQILTASYGEACTAVYDECSHELFSERAAKKEARSELTSTHEPSGVNTRAVSHTRLKQEITKGN